MKIRFGYVLALSVAFFPSGAFAWNARGHMTVAGIAWEKMTPQARQRATEFLKLNPDYDTWVDGFPAAERDRIAFMEAATWPDDLRGRVCSTGPDCIDDDGYTPSDANADLNIGYSDKRLRRYWHFKDLPFSTEGAPLEQPFSPNAETQIDFFSGSFRDAGVSDEAKSFNLSWLLHLVGDVHQPLHATARFSAASPNGDAGGNQVTVCKPTPATCVTQGRYRDTLHGLWDEAIGTSRSARSARTKADGLLAQLAISNGFLADVVADKDLNAPTSAWLSESFELAKGFAYANPIGPARGPYYPTQAYRTNAGSISEQQIVIAGLRLANLLNSRL